MIQQRSNEKRRNRVNGWISKQNYKCNSRSKYPVVVKLVVATTRATTERKRQHNFSECLPFVNLALSLSSVASPIYHIQLLLLLLLLTVVVWIFFFCRVTIRCRLILLLSFSFCSRRYGCFRFHYTWCECVCIFSRARFVFRSLCLFLWNHSFVHPVKKNCTLPLHRHERCVSCWLADSPVTKIESFARFLSFIRRTC